MSSERDPKVNPQPGDVLRKGSIIRRVVHGGQGPDGPFVYCYEDTAATTHSRQGRLRPASFRICLPYLNQFCQWARDAEVLERGKP